MEEKEKTVRIHFFLETKDSRYEVDMFFYSSHRDIQFFFFGQFPPRVCDVALSTHTGRRELASEGAVMKKK